jgi:hypothetical protein
MSIQFPVMTNELARRIQHVINSLHVGGMVYLQQQPGNPYGIEIKQFSNATAYLVRAIKAVEWWNRVVGLEQVDAALIDDILAFFRTHRLHCTIDMDPTVFTADFARLLVDMGLYPSPNGTILYGLALTSEVEVSADVTIREIFQDEIDLFLDLWADGFEFPRGTDTETIKGIRKGAFSIPGNRLYVAYVDNTPAAMAGLYMKDGIGNLSGGATLPAFRKRGCHIALTRRRITDAAKAGCDLVIGHTGSFASQSQNNMERAGLRIAYTMITWMDGAKIM